MIPLKYFIVIRNVVLGMLSSTMFFISCRDSDFNVEIATSHQLQSLPIRYQNILILVSDCDNSPCLKAISTSNGELIWEVNPWPKSFMKNGISFTPFIQNGNWIIVSDSSVHVFDLKAGKIIQKKTFSGLIEPNIFGHENYIFPVEYDLKLGKTTIYRWDMESHEILPWSSYTFDTESKVHLIGPIHFGSNQDAEFAHSLLIYKPRSITRNYFCFLNEKGELKDSFLLDSTNLLGLGVTKKPLIDKDFHLSYWHTITGITCLNLSTGKKQWSKNYNKTMIASRPIILDTTIIYPTDNDMFLIIDRFSGAQIAELDSMPHIPSQLFRCQNQLYFTDIEGKLNVLNYNPATKNYTNKSFLYKGNKPVYPSLYADNDIVAIHADTKWLIASPNKILDNFVPIGKLNHTKSEKQ